VKTVATALSALLLCLGALGCLAVSDDDGPILSIELFWDEKPDTAKFVAGTCNGADVDRMEWMLIRTDGDRDEVVATGDEDCANGIDVLEPENGEYSLEITGYDDDDQPLWDRVCEGFAVLRFDVGYRCDIDANNSAEATGE